MGASVHKDIENHKVKINSKNITSCVTPEELVKKMRASILVMGPLLARKGKATIQLPGGCAIGDRPVELHFKGLRALGSNIDISPEGTVTADCDKLIGTDIYLDFPSVGATENIVMAASLAQGTTLIENAAQEPEIVDLCNFLNKMGAKIKGAGTDRIKVEGLTQIGRASCRERV